MNSNTVTGLPAPTNASDAATRQFVLDNAAPVTSVNEQTGPVVLVASDIAITDTADNFTTNTVQGAIDQLFLSANNGKTSIADAIGNPAQATNTFAQLATHVTTGKGQIATATGGSVTSSNTFAEIAAAVVSMGDPTHGIVKTVTFDETIAKNDIVESYYKSLNLQRLTQPTDFPEGNVNGLAFSPNGKILAAAQSTTPFLSLFSFDEATNAIANLPNPGTSPTNVGNAAAFSPLGDFLAVAQNSNPTCNVYRNNGSNFIKLATPTGFSGSGGRGVAFSENSQYLSVATSGGLDVFFRSGETFTKLNDAEPYGSCYATDFHPGSRYVVITGTFTDRFKVMRLDGAGIATTLTKITVPNLTDSSAYSAKWSPDGTYLAVGHGGLNTTFGSGKIAIYKQTGDSFTRLAVSGGLSLGGSTTIQYVSGISWSKDGVYLYLTLNYSPSFQIYKRTGDTFTLQTSPTAPFATICNTVAVHPNNNIVSVGHDAGNFITHYQNNGNYLFVKSNVNIINPFNKIIGRAKEAGTQNQQKEVDVLVGRSLLP
jgi:WD40 repeat protein